MLFRGVSAISWETHRDALSVQPSHRLNHTRQDRRAWGTEQLTHSGAYRPPRTLFERMNQELG